jgi:hypothetical protein
VTPFDLCEIVVEDWLKNKTFSMLEFAFSLHYAIFPVANIDVTMAGIRSLFRPDVASITMLDSVY